MKVWQYALKRIILLIPIIIGVSLLTFSISHIIPGDPVSVALGPHATPELVEDLTKKWALDKPVFLQYLIYFRGLLKGDFGTSLHTNRPVIKDLKAYFPATLELTITSMILCLAVGIPLGIISATNKDNTVDHATRVFSLTGVSIPIFWLGLLLQLIFYYKLDILPGAARLSALISPPKHITGLYVLDSLFTGNWATLKDSIAHLIMPAFCLGFMVIGVICRMTRSSMLEVLQEDYIRTAEAKGLSRRKVVYVHAFRNAVIPVVTISGVLFGQLLAGAVLTETIFSWPGLGLYTVTSITNLDFQPIMGFTIIVAFAYVIINLIIDILYALIDPRIRLD